MYNKNKAYTPEKQLPIIQNLLIKLPDHPSDAQDMLACTCVHCTSFFFFFIKFWDLLPEVNIQIDRKDFICKYLHIFSHFLSFVFWFSSYFCSNQFFASNIFKIHKVFPFKKYLYFESYCCQLKQFVTIRRTCEILRRYNEI